MINSREDFEGQIPARRRVSLLEEFPDERFEAVVVQWDVRPPSVFVQLKRDAKEPIRFPNMKAGGKASSESPALDRPLHQFIDACTGRLFEKLAFEADIVFSARAFEVLQPEPDLVLPASIVFEARSEAIRAIGIPDEPGIKTYLKPE